MGSLETPEHMYFKKTQIKAKKGKQGRGIIRNKLPKKVMKIREKVRYVKDYAL